MVPSWLETGARALVIRYLKGFIETGCLSLLEEDGTIFTFEGIDKSCPLKVVLRVLSPHFYWRLATQEDLGLADAYINGDISFVDESEGLLNLLIVFVTNRDRKLSISRGWWTSLILTGGLGCAKYFIQHVSRRNTLTQARRNISRHDDLSNELFSLFMDETMAFSSAIFKTEGENLKIAQMRKISLLIEKAKISQDHHVLDMGMGWGSLALEIVKQTGCKYTGITPSEEQLSYAESKVKEAGLQDHVTLLLCDYRQIPDTVKYDRIIACEMLEAVGQELMENFFHLCDSELTENGILVLQFLSVPDERYDEYIRSTDFVKEYIFPDECLSSLSKITAAMAAASRLRVEHLENIGIHYYQTQRCWRTNFLKNKSKILALGFDEKFIRTWEYYFDYSAAEFKTCALATYQVVISRPGNNVVSFGASSSGDTPLHI